ncbi:SLAP domain-containing protein [Gracilibacillus caseinilyticus]|uniref:SLAP domain-containing protein n=1 Tax=Gracilibacillus caseinilyticus TaxID=2932256 RepID=A0ABY4EY50_9BACI|nr:SLAP domain-containing protein [Gracilibacillus caseinilyticus]UOQ48890.1 SLAP domain-containing protein [Gracilibacillus caseinilyticus]
MMQQLIFENAWDHTISDNDRKRIEQLFEETKTSASDGVLFTTIQVASNHRNDLLVTSLIHNFGESSADLTNASVQLVDKNNEDIATLQLQDDRLHMPAATSMPWTFIFPELGNKEQPDTNRTVLLSIKKSTH